MTVFSLLRTHRLLGLLAVQAALLWLAAIAVFVLVGSDDDMSIQQAATEQSAPEPSNDIVSVSATPDTPHWRAKPLFEPERRVARLEPAPAATPVADVKPDLLLTGVMIDGDRRFAVLQEQVNLETAILSPGENFKGWRLIEISEEHANLRSGSSDVTLDLFADDGRARVGHSAQSVSPQRPPDSETSTDPEATDTPAQASF